MIILCSYIILLVIDAAFGCLYNSEKQKAAHKNAAKLQLFFDKKKKIIQKMQKNWFLFSQNSKISRSKITALI